MSEMIERVARAIESEMGGKSIDMARAAIEAMREPTEAMIDAADETGDGGGISDTGCIEPTIYDLGVVWKAMIDAALSEKPLVLLRDIAL